MGTLRSAKQASEREAKSEVVEARKMMEEELENKIVSTQQKLKEEYHERRYVLQINFFMKTRAPCMLLMIRVEDTAALKKELQQIVESVDSELKSVRSELAVSLLSHPCVFFLCLSTHYRHNFFYLYLFSSLLLPYPSIFVSCALILAGSPLF